MTERGTEYRRLRAEYDAAYARLCFEQSRAPEPQRDWKRLDEALVEYRRTRDRLACLLLFPLDTPALPGCGAVASRELSSASPC